MKSKAKFEFRLDEDVCRKAAEVARHEGLTFNNYLTKLVRNSVAYHERVHGRIDPAKTDLPEGAARDE